MATTANVRNGQQFNGWLKLRSILDICPRDTKRWTPLILEPQQAEADVHMCDEARVKEIGERRQRVAQVWRKRVMRARNVKIGCLSRTCAEVKINRQMPKWKADRRANRINLEADTIQSIFMECLLCVRCVWGKGKLEHLNKRKNPECVRREAKACPARISFIYSFICNTIYWVTQF